MSRSLNKVQLIGNLTRDPEMRYTPQGTAVATFSVATNRSWKSEAGDKEEVEFHRIVAWDKLAEICSQLLKKGSKVFVEGRIQSRKWQTKEGEDRTTFEIVISEMMLLSGGSSGESYSSQEEPQYDDSDFSGPQTQTADSGKSKPKKSEPEEIEGPDDDDIPF